MAQNLPKDTAGRTLIGFAVLVLLVALLAVRSWWKRPDLEWARLPTAIEDTEFYTSLGDDDSVEPNLRFWVAPKGMVRLREKSYSRPDSRMWKLPAPVDSGFPMASGYARDIQDKVFIYRYEKEELDAETGLPSRYYVKSGDGRYVEFGFPEGQGPVDSSLQDGG